MTHPSELISAYLDGEVSGSERSQLLRHLSSCGRCAAEMEETQKVRGAVRSLPLLELPSALTLPGDEIVVPLRRRRGLWAGTAAAFVVLVIALAIMLTPPPPSLSMEDLSSRFGARVSLDPGFGPAKVTGPQFSVPVSE